MANKAFDNDTAIEHNEKNPPQHQEATAPPPAGLSGRRASVALNIVENPLKVSSCLACPDATRHGQTRRLTILTSSARISRECRCKCAKVRSSVRNGRQGHSVRPGRTRRTRPLQLRWNRWHRSSSDQCFGVRAGSQVEWTCYALVFDSALRYWSCNTRLGPDWLERSQLELPTGVWHCTTRKPTR